ncbi:hypothetical protein EDD18DRAFT_1112419 [Armillaria luteobubalina]|uniref:Uncharacterized protein n=1 Tax=Armillaria luteobubalina TaxID=153913 RepID=A0AA39PER9_9AGAR|nr:hypothetical protein EDD18DRAFT_1112419 [Armillaria luteobubalina]
MSFVMGAYPKDCTIEWKLEWANKDLFLKILQVINDKFGNLLCRAFEQGIPSAYEAFQKQHSLGYIAEKHRLHPELIEGLSDKRVNHNWKDNMKKNVSILAKCLKREKCHNRDSNQTLMSSNPFAGRLESYNESGLMMDPNMDIELGVLRYQDVDAIPRNTVTLEQQFLNKVS